MARKPKMPTDKALFNALPEDEEIRAEYDRLMTLYKDAPPATLSLYRKLISRAAFLAVTCDRLERDIAAHGYQQAYNNGGGQSGFKKSTAADLLPNYVKLQLAVTKQLHEALKAAVPEEEDELIEFLNRDAGFTDYLKEWDKDHNADIPAWARQKIESMDEFERFI